MHLFLIKEEVNKEAEMNLTQQCVLKIHCIYQEKKTRFILKGFQWSSSEIENTRFVEIIVTN